MKRTIGELLFDCYEDTVMDIGSSLDSDDDYFEEGDGAEEDPNKVPIIRLVKKRIRLKIIFVISEMVPAGLTVT